MTYARTAFLAVLLSAALSNSASLADPPATEPVDDGDGQVIVTRGTQTRIYGAPQKATNTRKQAGTQPTSEEVVIVHRPAAGSFMRETSRLSAEADAREEQAAQEEAREANQRLIVELEAREAAREEAAARPRKQRSRNLVPIAGGGAIDPATGKYYPGPPPPSPGVINPVTGQFYPNVGGGVINPVTGQFYPDVGAGYIDPTTGRFIPKR